MIGVLYSEYDDDDDEDDDDDDECNIQGGG